MKRLTSLLVLALVAAGVTGFLLLTDADEPQVKNVAAAQNAAVDSPPAAAHAVVAATPSAAAPSAAISADDVTRWTIEATAGDAGKRAAAITALSAAPVAQALPILRRVLMSGEPAVDRPLALRSLRDLALNHGDGDSAIRNAIREAIYHGDDQTTTADAQEALDVIEESLLK